MREEKIRNGLKFLQHPNVQATPLSERVTFLEGKGMSKDEIQEALRRHQAEAETIDQTTLQQQQQQLQTLPLMMTAAAPVYEMMQHRTRYPGFIRVLWTLSSLIGAASIATFLWNYAMQMGYIPWLRPMPSLIETDKVQKEKDDEKDKTLLAELTIVSTAIQEQTKELSKLSLSLDAKERDWQNKMMLGGQISCSIAEQGNAQLLAELKAEMSTLKALLLSKKTKNVSDLNVIDAAAICDDANACSHITIGKETVSTANNAHTVVDVQTVSKAERMQKALRQLRTENSLEQLKLAAGILSMYVKNLIENPDVPRYRRIAVNNANFKQKIEPLKHHEELLKSIGFEMSGLNMEWKWHMASKTTGAYDENIAILRAMLKALQSLTSATGSSNLSLEKIAHASLCEYISQQDERDTAISSHNTVPDRSHVSSSSTATSLDAFMTRLELQTSIVNDADDNVRNAQPSFVAKNVDSDEGKMSESSTSCVSSTMTPNKPFYPESFKEVLDLIQKGETVPGISNIEDKLSVDATTLLSEQANVGGKTVSKPWE